MADRASRAEEYRAKAEETRTVAASMKDPGAKKTLMTVSRDYITMAEILERLERSTPSRGA
jgi:hypothetical protein